MATYTAAVDEPAGILIRPFEPARDGAWADSMLEEAFGGRLQARRGEVIDALAGPALVAGRDGNAVGLVAYRVDDEGCEVTVLFSTEEGAGVGNALLAAVRERVAGTCSRLWLVTTNDNLCALGFYQRRGFVLRALRPGTVDVARARLKPSIPAVGEDGIPIRDELELELALD